MDYYQRQVHITKDGLDIQTTIEQFNGFYKRIGWKYVDCPPTLPGIVDNQVLPSNVVESLTAKQLELF